jgi:DNA-binding winged helix-turn-helix (wHTH) protein
VDSAVSTAARALSVGDPLEALKHVGLRTDPPALALRGIALAQLGEWAKALLLLRRAAKAFGDAEPVARARVVVAAAEVSLVLRDLRGAARGLDEAVNQLARRGDVANAAFARLVQVRRLVLLGQVEPAEQALGKLRLAQAPARLVALASLIRADVAMKRVHAAVAESALLDAERAASASRIPALVSEVESARQRLAAPVARLYRAGREHSVGLAELEQLLTSGEFLVDACRREVRQGARVVSLVTRPILLELLLALAETAPHEVARDALILRVFGARRANDSHRVRLRVEVGRLRRLLQRLAELKATDAGFALVPRGGQTPTLLQPPEGGEASELWALLRGGEAWATSALASALGKSQRSVQRALAELESDGKVRASGDGRARRWVATPAAGFATSLLLVAPGTLG